jgi:hypothetical protein
MTTELEPLLSRVGGFIQSCSRKPPGPSEDNFNRLALDIFRFQFHHNLSYGRFCRHQGISLDRIDDWRSIPPMPASGFKDLELTVLAPVERTEVFHSSGTTEHRPSRHFHNPETLVLYEQSLLGWFKPNFMPDRERLDFLFLTPPLAQAPHSSLVRMFEAVARELGTCKTCFTGKLDAEQRWDLDLGLTESALARGVEAREPLAICGTAFLFVQLCDWLASKGKRFELPTGSRVLETGGYKGRSRTVAKPELYEMIHRAVGVARSKIVSEYGMSELSAQAYDLGTKRFRFPPWARALVISPQTNKEVLEGEAGLLRVFDLANVASVLAVQTEDLAIRHADGFELLGRAAQAEPRGCSLASA